MKLISEEYRELNAKLHQTRADYGARGGRFVEAVQSLAQGLSTRDVLDYGCGKGHLRRALPMIDVKEYDPAIPGKMTEPEPADIVCCFDVLEHIEPDCLLAVITHLQKLVKKAYMVNVACRPAVKTLEDGSNTHKIIKPPIWWLGQLDSEDFSMVQYNRTGFKEFLAIYMRDEKPDSDAPD